MSIIVKVAIIYMVYRVKYMKFLQIEIYLQSILDILTLYKY